MMRDSLSRDKAEARLAAQKADAFYIEKANYVLYNNGNPQELYISLTNALAKENVPTETQK